LGDGASRRRLRRLRVTALVGFALVAMGVDDCACREALFGPFERDISRQEAEDILLFHPRARVQSYRVNGSTHVTITTGPRRGSATTSAIPRYLQGKGDFQIKAETPAGKRRLGKFTRGRFRGLGRAMVDNVIVPSEAEFSGRAKLIFKARGAGAACISFQGRTVGGSLQVAKGSFEVLGGTGAAKRLHAAGPFRAVIRRPRKKAVQASFQASPKLGSKRKMPKHCGTLAPVNGGGGKKVTADFKGFAVSNGAPPPSAALTQEDGTISSCPAGADLWGVVNYSGPKAARFATETGLKGVPGEKHSYGVRSGRNALRLLDLPFDNGGDPLTVAQISVKPTGSTRLSGDTYQSPYLFLDC
jgi:hypothetical protein